MAAEQEMFARWGECVREAREEAGLTQAALAAQAGVSQQLISAIERGAQGVGDGARRAIARALNKRPVDLFPYPEDLVPAS